MMTDYADVPSGVHSALQEGLVIPACPLALTEGGAFDERHQRALARYYHAAGAGGLAVGVHTTQFAIRRPEHGLFESVLELVAETLAVCDEKTGRQSIRIAGVCGPTAQATREARMARERGYHAGLLSLAALPQASVDELITHCEEVAREIPLVGFYLQPAVGGRVLPRSFWQRFARIPNVVAIKIAPFNRYHTLEVVRAVAEAGRAGDIALYTGNDDHIILDLMTTFAVPTSQGTVEVQMAGGLLGHWAFWTRAATQQLTACKQARDSEHVPARMLRLAQEVTDSNAAVFDAAHQFEGCIPGIHEVLRRQGLLSSRRCLDPQETLSAGQIDEIDRVQKAYPHLSDDAFVEEHLDEWLE